LRGFCLFNLVVSLNMRLNTDLCLFAAVVGCTVVVGVNVALFFAFALVQAPVVAIFV
jgi:hypothetical protein